MAAVFEPLIICISKTTNLSKQIQEIFRSEWSKKSIIPEQKIKSRNLFKQIVNHVATTCGGRV